MAQLGEGWNKRGGPSEIFQGPINAGGGGGGGGYLLLFLSFVMHICVRVCVCVCCVCVCTKQEGLELPLFTSLRRWHLPASGK